MNNKHVIEIIEDLCIRNEIPSLIDGDFVYTVVTYGYYFVKPGRDTKRFKKALKSALIKGLAAGTNDFVKTLGAYPIEVCNWHTVSGKLLKVVRKFFDREYFEAQKTVLLNDELNDEVLLSQYLDMLDQNQLFYFKKGAEYFSLSCDLFQAVDAPYINVLLTEKCREVDSSIPAADVEISKWYEFVKEKPQFMFDYLGKTEVAKIIDDFVARDRVLAGNLARALYYTRDYDASMFYSIMAHTFERMCGSAPYGVKPEFTPC